ncbi:MAG: response regulator transcription factor [Dehalococcoidia bacterium]
MLVATENEGSRALVSALATMDAQPLFAADLPAALESVRTSQPSLIAVDLSLRLPGHPEMEEFLAACKKLSPKLPVLALIPREALAAHDATPDFDDFACWPCPAQELASRMQRLLRRFKPPDELSVLKIENLVIDLGRYEVSQDGRRMDLTFKEYELLKFLAMNPGKVFTREMLLNRVWGYDYFGGTRTVDVHIRRLRSKIEDGTTSFIDTVRNVGYRFREPR